MLKMWQNKLVSSLTVFSEEQNELKNLRFRSKLSLLKRCTVSSLFAFCINNRSSSGGQKAQHLPNVYDIIPYRPLRRLAGCYGHSLALGEFCSRVSRRILESCGSVEARRFWYAWRRFVLAGEIIELAEFTSTSASCGLDEAGGEDGNADLCGERRGGGRWEGFTLFGSGCGTFYAFF